MQTMILKTAITQPIIIGKVVLFCIKPSFEASLVSSAFGSILSVEFDNVVKFETAGWNFEVN